MKKLRLETQLTGLKKSCKNLETILLHNSEQVRTKFSDTEKKLIELLQEHCDGNLEIRIPAIAPNGSMSVRLSVEYYYGVKMLSIKDDKGYDVTSPNIFTIVLILFSEIFENEK